mgnify:CR=1 FL=1
MHPIVALWAVPRSTSTAFEWMMRQRGDLHCLHEPFGEAWYQGERPLWPRWRSGDRTTPGLTLERVRDDILRLAEDGPLFIKDFPHYIVTLDDPDFLSRLTHAFLIRDPALTLTSIHDKWPDFDEREVGFAEQRALFDRLHESSGDAPPVLDSDDLLERPAAAVEAFCARVGIPFVEDALRWEPGASTAAYSWWDGGSFHANLRDSTGLAPQPRRYVELDEAPERVREVYRRVKPHYDRLRAHRVVL